jgi:hypothetical protein
MDEMKYKDLPTKELIDLIADTDERIRKTASNSSHLDQLKYGANVLKAEMRTRPDYLEYWINGEGKAVKITEMTNKHLQTIVRTFSVINISKSLMVLTWPNYPNIMAEVRKRGLIESKE